jgi:hypothetical protein
MVAIDRTAGTIIGDLTYGSAAITAAFDGTTTARTMGSCPQGPLTHGYIGKDWGAGVTHNIASFTYYPGGDAGFDNYTGGGQSISLSLYGSNTAPTSGTDGTQLWTETFADPNNFAPKSVSSGIASGDFRYHWFYMSAPSGGRIVCSQIVWSETLVAPNMTLLPGSGVSVSSAPAYMDAYFLWKDDSGSAVPGADLTVELSRDDGTTWTAATITVLAAFDGTYSLLKARAYVGVQPNGTSLKVRIKTLNNKAQRIAAVALYME